jgi:hypothetical protein
MAAEVGYWEESTGERERVEPEREEEEDVSWRRWASPGELLGGLGGKQEVALAMSRSRACMCFPGLNEEDKANLHIAP